jgi:hypothetical protein
MTVARGTPGPDGEETRRLRARDAAVRRSRAIVVGVVAGAVGLSGVFSVVAAHAFKGRMQPATSAPSPDLAPTAATRVPGPDRIPPIAGDPAPLQPPAQPPATPAPQPSSPAPEPQVSGGS